MTAKMQSRIQQGPYVWYVIKGEKAVVFSFSRLCKEIPEMDYEYMDDFFNHVSYELEKNLFERPEDEFFLALEWREGEINRCQSEGKFGRTLHASFEKEGFIVY